MLRNHKIKHTCLSYFPKRGIIFNIQKDNTSLYDILKIKPSANQREIKKAFYKLAKQYHPDRNEETEYNMERFKEVQKAYEVLNNPMSRQAYDLENRYNEEIRNDEREDIYEDTKYKRNFFTPRKISDFYYTKWTGYKKPDWYHPYNGYDVRSEYLYRKKLHDRAWFIPPYIDMTMEFLTKNRIFLYMGVLLFSDIIFYAFSFRDRQVKNMELEVLQISYNLDNKQDKTEGQEKEGEDEKGVSESEKRMNILLNNYVLERMQVLEKERMEQLGEDDKE